MLQVRRTAAGDSRVVVAASGQIDIETAPQLAEALAQPPEGRSEIVVDLGEVDFMDSAGVRVLVEAARKAAEAGGSLSVTGARDWVARVLEITGVEAYLRIEPAASADPGS